MVIIAITQAEATEAYNALCGMMEVFPPMMRKINFEGQGIRDEADCKRHLQLAANACLTLIAVMDGTDNAPSGAESEDIMNGIGCPLGKVNTNLPTPRMIDEKCVGYRCGDVDEPPCEACQECERCVDGVLDGEESE
ncbi:MAG: hypothetical protein LLF96_03090 [Eubacteriales bacterium]|nr:hypothetical protein [Eubacteriales bacterium]